MVDRPRDQMKTARDAAVAAGENLREIDSREVLAYLRAHPDFLEQHPEAVRLLRPPSREIGDRVVDFQHFLFERQKGEVARPSTPNTAILSASVEAISRARPGCTRRR